MGESEVRQRIAGRKHAAEWLKELAAELEDKDPAFIVGFARGLVDFARTVEPVDDGKHFMSEADAEVFENRELTYGAYVGLTRAEAPTDYMDFLIREAEILVAYSRTDAWQSRRA